MADLTTSRLRLIEKQRLYIASLESELVASKHVIKGQDQLIAGLEKLVAMYRALTPTETTT